MAALMLITALLCVFVSATAALATNEHEQQQQSHTSYAHDVYLDQSRTIEFKWRIATVQVAEQQSLSYLDAEISAPTRGYIGWGISPNGGMVGADILVMWVDDATGIAHMQDRYAEAFAEPLIDDDQTSILSYEGYQNATHTVFRFRRALDAGCSDPKHDLSVSQSATRVIYAIGEKDADPKNNFHIHYHGKSNRGMKVLYLLNDNHGQFERDRAAALSDTTSVIELRPKNVTIPAIDTFYSCLMHSLPTINQTIHVVGYEPALDSSGATNIVHHFVVYLCERGFVPESEQFSCLGAQSSKGGESRSMDNVGKCVHSVIWSWGAGSDALYMPEGVGFPFEAEDSGRYILIETHYDSSQLSAPRADNSGVRILLTNNLRPTSASHLLVGQAPGTGPVLPGRARSFTVAATCTSGCTNKYLPTTGINMFGVFLHAHHYGRSLVLRHFRNGSELPQIASDSNYDFNYQLWRRTNATILPGDELVLECNYTTSTTNSTIFAGWGTQEEMCIAFTYVTPSSALTNCVTWHSAELTLIAVAHQRPNVKLPIPRWVFEYPARDKKLIRNRRSSPSSTAEDEDLKGAPLDPRLLLIKSLFQRNESKMFEVDLIEQLPLEPKDAVKQALKGAGIIRAMVGLKQKLRRMDWLEQHDAIERLQRSYLNEHVSCGHHTIHRHLGFCMTEVDYFYEPKVPYYDYKTVSRPVWTEELASDQC